MTNERIKLDPLVNRLVRFKLHELGEPRDAVIRAFDQQGYWIESGSLAKYLRSTSAAGDVASEFQFVEYRRIAWIQKA